MSRKTTDHITGAQQIIGELGLPEAQRNERSALSLLALLNLTSDKRWPAAQAPLIGITPIMKWALEHYGKDYSIMPGMVASAEIMTGQKTVLDYLLKPINKARSEALTER